MRLLLYIIAASLVVLTATGCPVVVTCVDTGCRRAQVCNVESGQCEDEARDCRVRDICRSGEVCDSETGSCRPEQLRCTESFTCPDGQSCNASSGFCEPAFKCQSSDDCGDAEQCNLTTQECAPQDCESDADCPSSYVCDGESVCTSGCRPDADGCPAQNFCSVLTGDSLGVCLPNCRENTDCPFGQICRLGNGTDTQCVPEGECNADVDCRLDEVCTARSCGQPPCSSNDDCLDSQICDARRRTCRGADCAEDNFGAGDVPNHTRQTAFTLDFGNYTQLTLCAGRSDWFALDARGTDIVRVRLAQHDLSDDFDLYIFDEQGEQLAANQQAGQISSVKLAAGRDQILYIEVRPTTFAAGNYDLSIAREVCANDTFEENDTRAEATVVPSSTGVPSELALRACGFDEDWFRVRQNDANAGLRVERVQSTPDLRVEVLSPDGNRYVVQNDAPLLLLRAGTTGSSYVRATGALGQVGDYRLAFEILPPWICEGAGDHATAQSARPIDAGVETTETYCPLDGAWEIDWLELDVAEDGLLDLDLRPTLNTPALDVVLLSGDVLAPVVVREAVQTNGTAHLQVAVRSDTRWWLRVSAPGSLGRIADPPGYIVHYEVR